MITANRNKLTDFEVHLTIERACSIKCLTCERDIETFCKSSGWKETFINLDKGDFPNQLMITKRFFDEKQNVYDEALETIEWLNDVYKINVNRLKIEVPPWDAHVLDLSGKYFESHIKVLLKNEDLDRFNNFSKENGGHISLNAFKVREDGLHERFITLRGYGTYEEFSYEHLKLMLALEEEFNVIEEPEFEYVIHDSNLDLDKGWSH